MDTWCTSWIDALGEIAVLYYFKVHNVYDRYFLISLMESTWNQDMESEKRERKKIKVSYSHLKSDLPRRRS